MAHFLSRSCFVAGTPLPTPEGSKPIEEFVPGDLVLSRDEDDPDGPVVAKVVEAVFVRYAPTLNVHIDGRVIGTTKEHPLHVQDKGWTAAGFLRMGIWSRERGSSGWRWTESHLAGTCRLSIIYN